MLLPIFTELLGVHQLSAHTSSYFQDLGDEIYQHLVCIFQPESSIVIGYVLASVDLEGHRTSRAAALISESLKRTGFQTLSLRLNTSGNVFKVVPYIPK